MSMHVGVGFSRNLNSFAAAQEACGRALQQAKTDLFDLILLFADVRFNGQRLIEGVKSVCPEANLIGASSAGEITKQGPERFSVVLMGIAAEKIHFSLGLGQKISDNPYQAGKESALAALRARYPKRHLFLLFLDGLSGNAAEVIRGAQEILGLSFPIVGGSAADNFTFSQTFQYFQNQSLSDAACGVLFSGSISLGIGMRHGWHPIGKTRTITRSHGYVIEEIDNQPAVSVYEEYFGQAGKDFGKETLSQMAINYPLGMSIPEESEYLIRHAVRVDEKGNLVCSADVPQGSEVRLMITDRKTVIQSARQAAAEALKGLGLAKPRAAIVFDSLARLKVLGRQAGSEIEVLKEVLGDIPLAGLYAYGELAPLHSELYQGKAYFHNQSIVILLIGEE